MKTLVHHDPLVSLCKRQPQHLGRRSFVLSRAYGTLGQNGQSHRYLTESYYPSGQTEPAIKQIRIALDQTEGNHYLTALLEDPLKVFVTEEAERKKNEN